MKLAELKTTNVGGLPDGVYSFVDARGEPKRVTFITGGPASGKSTLLEAIVAAKETVGPYGALGARFATLRRAGAEAATIDARWPLSVPEQAAARTSNVEVNATSTIGESTLLAPTCSPHVRSLFSDEAPAPAGGGLAWFDARRAFTVERRPTTPVPFTWLAPDNRRYESLVRDVATSIQQDALATAEAMRERGVFPGAVPSLQSEVREALLPFLRDKALQRVHVGDGDAELYFVDRAGRVTTTAHLGASERQGVLFVLALRARPAQYGVVLIDEPELHVHPREHTTFFASILALAPHAQFVVATSSPSLLTNAEAVIDLDRLGRGR